MEYSEIDITKLKEYPPDSWIVRPCEIYRKEYRECIGPRKRFHQYFIHGEFEDCSDRKENYKLCKKFRKKNDLEALAQVVENEKQQKSKRLEGNYRNDVWQKRKNKPPDNWNSPLPSNIKKSTYFQATNTVKNNGVMFRDSTSCVIL